MINEKKDGSLRSKAETGTGISVLSVSAHEEEADRLPFRTGYLHPVAFAVKTTARSDPKIFTAGCHIDNFRNGRQSFFRTSDNHTDVFQIFLKFDTG